MSAISVSITGIITEGSNTLSELMNGKCDEFLLGQLVGGLYACYNYRGGGACRQDTYIYPAELGNIHYREDTYVGRVLSIGSFSLISSEGR